MSYFAMKRSEREAIRRRVKLQNEAEQRRKEQRRKADKQAAGKSKLTKAKKREISERVKHSFECLRRNGKVVQKDEVREEAFEGEAHHQARQVAMLTFGFLLFAIVFPKTTSGLIMFVVRLLVIVVLLLRRLY